MSDGVKTDDNSHSRKQTRVNGKNRRICFVGLDNYAFLRPDLGITHMGGEAVQQSLLARYFAQENFEVSTIVLDSEQPSDERIDDISIIKAYKPNVGIKGLRFFHPRISGVWKALREANADIYYQSPAGLLTGITAAFCQVFKRQFIFRIASDANCIPGEQLIGLWRDRKIYEYGLRKADVRAVQTRKQAALLSKHYKVNSVVVNMVTENIEVSESTIKSIDVLWVNNLRNVKRPDRVIHLARRLPELNFIMIGGASRGSKSLYEDIESEAAQISNLQFLGSKSYAYVNECLSRSKVLLNTSDLEGFPNTFLQAWMRGVPVVTTFDPDNLVHTNKLGAAVDNTEELPDLLRSFLANSHLRTDCSTRVSLFARRYFSPDAVIKKYLGLLI